MTAPAPVAPRPLGLIVPRVSPASIAPRARAPLDGVEPREGLPLRGPPTWDGPGLWPPTVEEAKASLDASRNRRRSVWRLFNLGGALAWEGWRDDDVGKLAEAYAIFIEIATEGGSLYDRYRPLALINATVTLDVIPYDLAKQMAGELMLAAMQAIEGEMRAQLVTRVQDVIRRVEEQEHEVAMLRWTVRGDRLIPVERWGREYLVYIPSGGYSGSWEGVSHMLLNSAFFQAPESCHVPEPILVLPDRTGLRVRAL